MTVQELVNLLHDPSYYQGISSTGFRYAHHSFSGNGLRKLSNSANNSDSEDNRENSEFGIGPHNSNKGNNKYPDFKYGKIKYPKSIQ